LIPILPKVGTQKVDSFYARGWPHITQSHPFLFIGAPGKEEGVRGTWHCYVDYWALNTITIKDRFPVPMIDELLDELGKAS